MYNIKIYLDGWWFGRRLKIRLFYKRYRFIDCFWQSRTILSNIVTIIFQSLSLCLRAIE
jgi:hypothetical protein